MDRTGHPPALLLHASLHVTPRPQLRPGLLLASLRSELRATRCLLTHPRHTNRMAAHGFVSNESKLRAENDELRANLNNVINAARSTQDVLRRLWSQHESEQTQIQQLKAELLQARGGRGRGARSTSEGEEGGLPEEEDEAGASGKWNLLAWTRGAGFHRVVNAALQKAMADQGFGSDSGAALEFIRGLKDQGEIDGLLRTGEVMGALSDLLWSAIETLQRAGAATSEEIQGKFAGSIELSYSGLDTFFGGLESIVGSPNPNLRRTMEDEHTKGADAGQEFTTRYTAPLPAHSTDPAVSESQSRSPHSNYGVKTTSRTEWSFVVTDSDTPEQLGLTRWPAESIEKLHDRNKCRLKPLLTQLVEIANQAGGPNEQLKKANQPELVEEELIAANLYTGPVHAPPRPRHACCLSPFHTSPFPLPPFAYPTPTLQMFVKYNAILRGLQSGSDFLKNTMVQLCCPMKDWEPYIGTANIFQPANGALSFEQVKSSLNKYTTTLHGINSAIIKLGKLTKATKVRLSKCSLPPPLPLCALSSTTLLVITILSMVQVYRGISGMALPDAFWHANEFGVRGGVESAFMSTTLERNVAMGYASDDKATMGIVIEAQQGQVNRGADMSWLSQYPHERECAAHTFESAWPRAHALTNLPRVSQNSLWPADWHRGAGHAHRRHGRGDRVRLLHQPDGAHSGAGAQQAAQAGRGHRLQHGA